MAFHVDLLGTVSVGVSRLGAVQRRQQPCRFCGSRWFHDLHISGSRWPTSRCSGCNREVDPYRGGWTISDDSGARADTSRVRALLDEQRAS